MKHTYSLLFSQRMKTQNCVVSHHPAESLPNGGTPNQTVFEPPPTPPAPGGLGESGWWWFGMSRGRNVVGRRHVNVCCVSLGRSVEAERAHFRGFFGARHGFRHPLPPGGTWVTAPGQRHSLTSWALIGCFAQKFLSG